MKKLSAILYFMLSILWFSACTEQQEPNMSWLDEKIRELESYTDELSRYNYVMTGIYESGRVYIFANCCPHCNSVFPVYNIDGIHLGNMSPSGVNGIAYEAISNKEVYWKHEDSLCNFE